MIGQRLPFSKRILYISQTNTIPICSNQKGYYTAYPRFKATWREVRPHIDKIKYRVCWYSAACRHYLSWLRKRVKTSAACNSPVSWTAMDTLLNCGAWTRINPCELSWLEIPTETNREGERYTYSPLCCHKHFKRKHCTHFTHTHTRPGLHCKNEELGYIPALLFNKLQTRFGLKALSWEWQVLPWLLTIHYIVKENSNCINC